MSGQLKLLANLVEDVVGLLSSAESGKSRTIRITIAVEAGSSITIILAHESIISVPDPQLRSRILGEIGNSIVRVLQECKTPLRGKEIAAKLGEPFTSRFRQMLAVLCKHQIISKTIQGYCAHPN